eukprot:1177082-Prorocentrum_minimum.AAC.4
MSPGSIWASILPCFQLHLTTHSLTATLASTWWSTIRALLTRPRISSARHRGAQKGGAIVGPSSLVRWGHPTAQPLRLYHDCITLNH